MEKIEQIKLLDNLGIGTKTIARQLGISKNTVKSYLTKKTDTVADNTVQEKRINELHAFFPYCVEELKRKGVTRQILWGEYRAKHPDGYGYSMFCDHFVRWTGTQNASLHLEQQPGDRMYVDFTGQKLSVVDTETGEIKEAEVFVSVLGYSGLSYVKACESQRKEDFLGCISDALEYYGGVPKVLIPDNLKSAVNKANQYEPEINKDLLDLGNHYGMAVMPARSRKPKDKAWVERMVGIVYTRIFAPMRNRIFTSLEELNEAVFDLMEAHNDQALQKRPESRRELYNRDELKCMQPLSTERYELKEHQLSKVMKNGHIQILKDRHYYSVPYKYIGQKVKTVYSASHVSIYCNGERIAYHMRDYKKHKYTTVKEHLSSTHQFVGDWNPERFIRWAASLDPVVEAYIKRVLDNKSYPEQTYRSCVGILSFAKKVGKERLIAACKRASEYEVFNYKVIDQIIRNKLDRQPDEHTQGTLPLHDNIRGAGYYK